MTGPESVARVAELATTGGYDCLAWLAASLDNDEWSDSDLRVAGEQLGLAVDVLERARCEVWRLRGVRLDEEAPVQP